MNVASTFCSEPWARPEQQAGEPGQGKGPEPCSSARPRQHVSCLLTSFVFLLFLVILLFFIFLSHRREIVIHVCDETRGTKKDFTCPQGLLLEKMVYFRDITLGQQLDDVDISVHCDVKIFDWLM